MLRAKFSIGQVVRHKFFGFRGVIFDVDPEFKNTEEWYNAIPEPVRPRKDQPFYHLLTEGGDDPDDGHSVAYVSEQNLQPDDTGRPVAHPHAQILFRRYKNGRYQLREHVIH